MTEEDYEPEHKAEDGPTKGPLLNSKMYDRLKWVSIILLPAIGALYFALSGYWDLPKTEEVMGTCLTLGIFLGTLLGISKKKYDNSDARFDGELEVYRTEEGDAIRVVSNEDVSGVAQKKAVTLRVQNM